MHQETPTTEASTDAVGMPPAETNVTDLILASAAEAPDAPVYALRNGAGAWLDVRFDAFLDQVRAVAKGLMARGVDRGDRVALFAATSYEWAVLDQAVWFAGAVSVPIYETSSAHQVAHILGDSGAVLAGVGTPALDARTREAAALASCTVDTFPMTPEGLDELVREGRDVPDEELEAAGAAATLADPA